MIGRPRYPSYTGVRVRQLLGARHRESRISSPRIDRSGVAAIPTVAGAIQPTLCQRPGDGILIAIAADQHAPGPVHVGITLARERHARITIVGIASARPFQPIVVPMTIIPPTVWTLKERYGALVDRNFRRLIDDVPSDVPVMYLLRYGQPATVIDSILADGGFEAVALHGGWTTTRSCRRAMRRWCHSGVAVHAAWV